MASGEPAVKEGASSRRRTILRLIAFAIIGLVVYVGGTFLQVVFASTQDNRRESEAIIVLGAAQYDGVPSPVLEERLDHAAELWRAGVAPVIVVTGGKQEGDRFTEAAASFAYLRQEGIPEGNILREEQGTNTWEQLSAATRFLRQRNIRTAVLVSDDYHAYRLDVIADELGLDAAVSPVDPGLSVTGRAKALGRETAAVSVGRVIGFRRLVNLDETINDATG